MDLNRRSVQTSRHTTSYVECGPPDGPLMFFLHGWPGIALMWRAQMNAFGQEGWRCIAPDMRGYGASSAPEAANVYSIREAVADMVELHDHLGGQPAIWVSHDWGCVVAAELSAHEPVRSRGLVLTSLAYQPAGHALSTIVPLVDRSIYPVDEYPDGQWDYYWYYTRNFESAVADLDTDVASSLASIYRAGDPAGVGKVAPHAKVTQMGGRFGYAHRAPPTELDAAVWPPEDFKALVGAFERTGFRPSCAWYLNDEDNVAFAKESPDGGRLSQPVLFINGDYDQVCNVLGNRQGDPMREACKDLTVETLPAGHWLPLERSEDHIRTIRNWLKAKHFSALTETT